MMAWVSLEAFAHALQHSVDPADLLQMAVFVVETLEQQHPTAAAALAGIDATLKELALLPRTTTGDYDVVIDATLQIIQRVQQLPFATVELQTVLGQYLRIMEAKQVEAIEKG